MKELDVDVSPPAIRAIPFQKLVGGVSGVSFSDHPAAIFHFFLGYPGVSFFPLTQCKNSPSDHPAVISELFSDHPAAFFKRAPDTLPTNFSNGIVLTINFRLVLTHVTFDMWPLT